MERGNLMPATAVLKYMQPHISFRASLYDDLRIFAADF